MFVSDPLVSGRQEPATAGPGVSHLERLGQSGALGEAGARQEAGAEHPRVMEDRAASGDKEL